MYRDNIYEKKISSWIYSPVSSAYINISQYSLTLVAFAETLSLLLQTMIGDKKWKEKRRNFPYARNRLVNTRSILWILDLTCVYKWMSLRRVNKRDAINSPVGGIISRENGNQCPRFLGWGEILVHGTRKQYRRENRNGRKREREREGDEWKSRDVVFESLRMLVIKVSGLESHRVGSRTSLTFDKTTISSLAKRIECGRVLMRFFKEIYFPRRIFTQQTNRLIRLEIIRKYLQFLLKKKIQSVRSRFLRKVYQILKRRNLLQGIVENYFYRGLYKIRVFITFKNF